MPNDDLTLLREYSRNHSEPAFAALVSRHVNLVYSVALRQVRDPLMAEEITQAVFIILARKADSLGDKSIFSSWLCRTARYVSARALRTQIRRQQREQKAHMQSVLNEPESETWTHIAPLLDGAMEKLGQKDHDALVLRFFENKNFAEVGAALGASEDAAKMRVQRALEKLRKFFTKRGVSSTTAILAGAISANSVQAAPAALAKTVTAVAVAKGAVASTSTLTLIKGALKIMAWTKMKMAVVVGMGVLLAAGTTTITVKKIMEHQNEEWQLGKIHDEFLLKPPFKTVILPTKSAKRSLENGSGGMVDMADGRVLGINAPIEEMVRTACAPNGSSSLVSPARTVIDAGVPTNKYDFYSNLPLGSRESLKREIKIKFGVVDRFETMETNVLILKVKYPNTVGLKPSVSKIGSTSEGNGRISAVNSSADDLARLLEDSSQIPVVNQTGLTGKYDFKIQWDEYGKKVGSQHPDYPNLDGLKQALLNQLGLELVPSREPIEMLVVENAK